MKIKTCLVAVAALALLQSALIQADEKQPAEKAAQSVAAKAQQTQPPISERFGGETKETPEFRKHVVPLLGKLGCNGRACHGSFQGQGDFRLSLFGYDFKMDHEGLNDRLDTDAPADSYALQKPTLQEPHKGGKRMDVGSWEYNVFLNWIKAGAKNVDDKTPDLVRVEVEPRELVFQKKGDKQQLKAVAIWSDGSQEDVTPLCRYQSNSEQIAEVNSTGLVTALEPGDSHVVVFYDKSVLPIPVLQPVSNRIGPKYPQVAAASKVDALVVQKLKKLGIVQSETCTDAEFLRRVSLDMTGSLPTPAEVEHFLSDSSHDKRAKKIDELLERPTYTAWWTTKLCDFTGNSDDQLNNVGVNGSASKDWYQWLYSRVEDNVPYDQLVEGIVMAVSRNKGENYQEYCENMTEIYKKGGNSSYGERDFMPHFWSRRNFQQPNDRAIGFAYTFLGIRIQCAQCHKHPFDQWTQDDFKNFTGFFTGTSGRSQAPAPASKKEYADMLASLDIDKKLRGNLLRRELAKIAREGKVIPFGEVYPLTPPKKPKVVKGKKTRKSRSRVAAKASLLGGETIEFAGMDDIRAPLMNWLRAPENKLFSRAFVNRVWASYFNVGIVEPPDDHSLANPPSNAALLDYLAEGFVANNYDMKWLHREITNSRTYQLSWQPNETNELDDRNFSHAIPRRLPAEAAYDALVQATSSDTRFKALQTSIDGRAIAIPGAGRRARGVSADLRYAMEIFGRSIRESNCDCDRSQESSLLQTVFLRNDQLTLSMIDDSKNGWLADIARNAGIPFKPQVTRSGSAGADARRKAAKVKSYRNQIKSYQKQVKTLSGQLEAAKKRLTKSRDIDNKRGIASAEKQVKAIQLRMKKAQQTLEKMRRRLRVETGEVVVAKNDKEAKNTTTAKIDSQAVIKQAYLRTLSRMPSDDEMQSSLAFLDHSEGDAINGVRGLLWALLNTKEFIVNH